MSNWDPQTPSENINQSTYELSFTYDIDASHQGTITFQVANINDVDSNVIESFVAAVASSADWDLNYGFRNWGVVQRLDDGF